MKKTLAALLFAASGLAMASSCPKEMAAIDAAVAKGTSLSASQMEEVRKLRAEGERLHKEGKHAESVAALGQAKRLLGI
ncbi:hypothetical protein M6I34_12645 [Burkholderiaceae bacterium FT117]|uniref:hypothetical protein n=1 Tax=Zeimonas sediminis TaxID=2944268 RepID=UPI002342C6AF|nr:hypothetical protein [Zeimonas sediminis]MCM5571359.1 hypothetical protein [Zeimonas sediminis]